ncbi:sterol desaturase family protein [Mucilaginibacter myungsuensis]|uniref:Sterol desaturase family protein n=2 Tax=Mucilaginibacter myungsuensis TaxID=649104 RepID=A0A929PX86_9SPHI|nr:sterol desaturase family protein [Mucilaginibacter myungsuensis]MBE9661972.1 sterol desaturase family protein [Mucilaginibacter myungsuensis]
MEQVIDIFIKAFAISTIRYFLIAGVAFLLCYTLFGRKLIANKIQPKLAARKDFIREILHSIQTTAVLTVVGMIVIMSPVRNYTLMYTDINEYPIWWIYACVPFALIIHDTYFYWMHRTLHHPRLFKYTHLLHHKSTNPSPWASYSFHFIEAWTEGAVLIFIVCLIPMHRAGVMLFLLTSFTINVYGHLGYEVVPLWFRRTLAFQFFNTSVHHNMHHSKFKGNYGLYFRVWDRVMGTEHPDYVQEFDRVQAQRVAANEAKRSKVLNSNVASSST